MTNAQRWILGLGLVLCTATGFYNIGIIALDDYSNGIGRMAPAQYAPPLEAYKNSLHPVIPQILLSALARFFYRLGALDPVWQLRWAFAFLGLLSFIVHALAAHWLFPPKKEHEDSQRTVAFFLISFYFAFPLFFSRPMIESLSMPWLALSAACAARYGRGEQVGWLLASLGLLVLSSLMRFQAGVCLVALIYLVIYRRSWRDAALFAMAALAAFVFTGLLDQAISGGEFHRNLRAYFLYSFFHAGDHYGRMPFYTFAILLFALTLPPALFSRYSGFHWRRAYRPLVAPVLYVVIFFLLHSLSPHKEDRFILPILSLFVLTLVPLATYVWKTPGHRFHRIWFMAINGVLLFFTCSNIPQNNVISLARWIGTRPDISRVIALDGALAITPRAYLERQIDWQGMASKEVSTTDCHTLVVRHSADPMPADWARRYQLVQEFRPYWLEQLLIQANPKHNLRRGALLGYLAAGCGSL